MNAIETKNLTKKYKDKTAVDSLNLTVGEGELFSLLGVNGAGKTTTIRMLSCLSTPTSGEAYVNGKSCKDNKDEIKKIIGISPQDTAVADNLTVRENLDFMASVYYTDKASIKEKVDNIIQTFNLSEVENQKAKTLSGGWKRKLSIAMALISEPKVLFLDEPTLGLDVLARRELWHTIEGLKGKMTIILTTHYMEEAEHLSDRIAIMISGKIRACGTVSDLEKLSGKKGLEEAFVAIAERGMSEDE
ncbi:MAG: ABC transporter ATP-binding protein [Lachnospiraceae bacterium]|nr:ABC transporter ATP-binding protein [Lachnospiraceae bacterium]MBQ9234820.1 ABC transporter ATP-binding protein [Lachnospiraceae bacterium]MBQ9608426.1 ABC transporter ATP-binding protein [Lachnospiraceae bacterium]